MQRLPHFDVHVFPLEFSAQPSEREHCKHKTRTDHPQEIDKTLLSFDQVHRARRMVYLP